MSLIGRRVLGAPSIEEQVATELDAARQHDLAAANCDEALDELAAREAAGDISAAEVDQELVEINARAQRAREGAAHRRRVAALLEDDLARQREAEAVEAYRRALEEARRQAAKARERSRKTATMAASLARDAAALEKAREAASAAVDAARELLPAGWEFPIDPASFGDFDEVDWGSLDVDELTRFLAAGPSRPYAESISSRADAERRQQAEDRKQVADAVAADLTLPPAMLRDVSQVERLPERLRPQARELFDERRSAARNAV